jgi:ATP-dependent helicase IRC3
VIVQARGYQLDCLREIHAGGARGLQRIIAALATGLGKSVIAALLARERGGRAVFLAHRDELIRQLVGKIRMVWPEVSVGVVKAAEDEVNAGIVVASVQTLARPARLERLLASTRGRGLFDEGEPFRTVVVDEVHHYLAGDDGNTFGRVLEGLGCTTPGGPLTVGFTATPERGDGGALGNTWEEIVYEMGILDGIRGGFLCELRAKQVRLQADFGKLKVRAGEFRDEETAEMLMEANAPKHAVQAYLDNAAGLKAIAFTPTVAVAHAFAEEFRARGVAAEAIDGTLDTDLRRAILRRLSTGETRVVPNCAVLIEGFDEPSVGCIIIAKPTRSRPTYVQMVGRGTRLYPGKPDCLILDVVGIATRHDLATMATLFQLDEDSPELQEKGVMSALAARDSKGGAAPKAAEDESADGRLVSVDVQLFTARDFAWVPGSTGDKFTLSLGTDGHLVIQPGEQPGTWDVVQQKRVQDGTYYKDGARHPKYKTDRQKLYAGLDIGYAMGAGEDYVRKSGKAVLNAKDAAWRTEAPTEKQVALLRRRGRWRDGMSKGEASSAIDALFAR